MADQEHVELEQVPLKSDTDAPAVDDGKTEAVEEKTVEKQVGGKKWTFFSRTKKAAHVDDEGKAVEVTTTETTTTVTKPKTATLKGWFAKKECRGDGEKKTDEASKMTIGINLLDRDERSINEHVKVGCARNLGPIAR
uniref:Uncharacterized protein n=1 Tax=Plectus sambesii TaxID=2011161 RepID=A0A914VHH7_9BILA